SLEFGVLTAQAGGLVGHEHPDRAHAADGHHRQSEEPLCKPHVSRPVRGRDQRPGSLSAAMQSITALPNLYDSFCACVARTRKKRSTNCIGRFGFWRGTEGKGSPYGPPVGCPDTSWPGTDSTARCFV